MEPRERDYQSRTWKTYEIQVHGSDEPALQKCHQFFEVCNSDSEMAKRLGCAACRLYSDYEMVAADIDPIFGGDGPYELAKEWRGHPAGSLIFRVYTGMDKNPMTWTYMVEIPSGA